jgi:hypothetical protein
MEAATDTTSAGHLDTSWLRAQVEELSAIHRPSASPGEREAAEWLVARLGEEGAEGRIEVEDGHGGYWWPLAVANAAGVLAGLAALRGRRLAPAVLGGVGALAALDEMPPRQRRLRKQMRRRPMYNVVAELGPADAERTVVLVAHHDTAHPGLVFHPAIPQIADRLGLIEKNNTSPGLMWPLIAAPAIAGLGGLLGSRLLARVGTIVSLGSAAAMADIGLRDSVPGANDNATGVAVLLAIARALAKEPTQSVRVMLLSTSEEATCEGMQAFCERHCPSLPTDSTFFLAVDTVGSPHLLVLRGEGMAGLVEYPRESLELLDGLAEELGIYLFPRLRLRNATDAVFPLNMGYQCASLNSCTNLKQPANYHWPTDTADRVNYDSVADAVRLTEAVVRRLDERWL